MNPSPTDVVRLAHFSDIHVTAPACVWRARDYFSKRLSSWANLRLLGRGARFRRTEQVLSALAADLRQRRHDRLVFSGDATALGFEEEVARAAHILGVNAPDAQPGLAVPGNHDYCTHSAMLGGHFERYFANWQNGERIGDAVYPFAQRVGHLWLIGVNSAVANRWPTDASGAVGHLQLRRLEELFDRLSPGPRILVTHYPVWLANGQREGRQHRLRDLDDVVAVAQRGGVCLWLHGHRHDAYHHHPSDFAPFPVICAGSATQTGLWSYSEYEIEGTHLRGRHRVYDPAGHRFRDGVSFDLHLPSPRPAPVS
jgi:3',5'-cyclic AMP phosphodiesterase CpdA